PAEHECEKDLMRVAAFYEKEEPCKTPEDTVDRRAVNVSLSPLERFGDRGFLLEVGATEPIASQVSDQDQKQPDGKEWSWNFCPGYCRQDGGIDDRCDQSRRPLLIQELDLRGLYFGRMVCLHQACCAF